MTSFASFRVQRWVRMVHGFSKAVRTTALFGPPSKTYLGHTLVVRISVTSAMDQRSMLALWVSLSLALVVIGLATLLIVRLMRRKERINTLYGVARLDFRHASGLTKSVVTRGDRAVLTGQDLHGHAIGENGVTRLPRYATLTIYGSITGDHCELRSLTQKQIHIRKIGQVFFRASLRRAPTLAPINDGTVAEFLSRKSLDAIHLQIVSARSRSRL